MKLFKLLGLLTALFLSYTTQIQAQCTVTYNWTASGNVVAFSGSTSGMNSSSTFYSWSFGDGSFGSGLNPSHTYSGTGSYSVCVTASDSNCTVTYCDSVTVGNSNPCTGFSATAWAYTDTSSNTNGLVYFGAQTTSGNPQFAYTWDFGDGNFGTGQNPNHTYANPNNWYLYCVTVTDTLGCTATYCDSVDANNPCADTSLFANMTYTTGFNNWIHFTSYTGTNPSSYYWAFGDGTTSNLAHPSHQYNSSGSYTVTLVVYFPNGCSRYQTFVVNVVNNNPCNGFSASYTSSVNGSVVSFASTVNGAGGPYNYSWNFGDGGTSTATNPLYTYSSNGNFGVSLIVTDSNGCTANYWDSVSVGNSNPCSGFSTTAWGYSDTSSTSNGLVYFGAQPSGGSPVYGYTWDFGDGNFGTGQYPSHTYSNPNNWYLYCVTVTDTSGCTATYCDSVDANNPCSDTTLYAYFSHVDSGNLVHFIPSTGQTPISYYWFFGDGTTSSQASPYHQYTTNGSYTVSLYVTFASGCSRMYSQVITVNNNNSPCAGFSAAYTYTTNGGVVTFNSTITGGTSPITYSWNFGDGGSSTQANPIHTYTNTSTYYGAYLIATDANGCVYTAYDTVSFSSNPCTQNEVTLTLNFDNYAYETSWDLRDGLGAVVASGSGYTPNQNGTALTQTFCLPTDCYVFNIYDSYGDGICCLYGQGDYTLTDALGNVLASGGAFGYSDSKTICVGGATNPCSGFTTHFTSSTNGNVVNFTTTGSGLQYVWDFGDNTVGSGSNPVHTYANAPASGYYTVCVTAFDSLGCTATYCDSVAVNPLPCNNNLVTLTLNFDNFAYETTWTITDANNSVVHSGNGYTTANNGTTQSLNFCLPTGCYDFNIYDSYGDGICCAWGQGSYTLTDASNAVLASGGSFTSSEHSNFCVGGATNPCGNFSTSFTYSVAANGVVSYTSSTTGGTAPYTYSWTFGNNNISSQANPTNTFSNNGNFTTCLTVTDANGCSLTLCYNVVVSTNNNSAPCNGLTVDMNITQDTTNPFVLWMQPVITNAAPNAYFYYIWDFGDNTGAFNGSPAHQYNNYGSYIVCLTAFDSVNNCVASFCDTITIDSSGNFSRNINYKDVKPGFLINTLPAVISYYTNTVAVEENALTLSIFPNPASNEVNLSVLSDEEVDGALSILDIAGKTILEKAVNFSSGENTHTINVNSLPSGVYLMRITSDSVQKTMKFIKE